MNQQTKKLDSAGTLDWSQNSTSSFTAIPMFEERAPDTTSMSRESFESGQQTLAQTAWCILNLTLSDGEQLLTHMLLELNVNHHLVHPSRCFKKSCPPFIQKDCDDLLYHTWITRHSQSLSNHLWVVTLWPVFGRYQNSFPWAHCYIQMWMTSTKIVDNMTS